MEPDRDHHGIDLLVELDVFHHRPFDPDQPRP